jgi:hypothetical protein
MSYGSGQLIQVLSADDNVDVRRSLDILLLFIFNPMSCSVGSKEKIFDSQIKPMFIVRHLFNSACSHRNICKVAVPLSNDKLNYSNFQSLLWQKFGTTLTYINDNNNIQCPKRMIFFCPKHIKKFLHLAFLFSHAIS